MSQNNELNEQDARSLLEGMLLIRRAEERLGKVKAETGLPGSVHLSIGQEAIAVGVCSQLDERDWIGSTHRGHGHFLAKGGELKRMYAEIWAKRTGICQGMGGSMHVADFSKGIMGANGIVGGGLAIATGAGLGAQLEGKGGVSICFFGDGAANQGVFMESMNMATIWTLPVIFVCENNGIAEFTVSSTVTGGALSDRARAFKMPVAEIDGNDVLAVREAAAEAVRRARSGGGPSYIEAITYRIPGHLEGEDMLLGGGKYREIDEIAAWQSPDKDPIARFTEKVITVGLLDREAVDAIDQAVLGRVDEAVKFAEESEDADPELVYSLYPSARKELDFAQ
jgi:acetoin:2,6-dichlorophenolindophenol oxidoreductase subunit alpha